ncbi:hypothetical protein [Chryseobacterium gwangjuense]|uniref:hypothetical protein n=1 Tax=Chryseobacterium gwangjuense TaxID=1069980 RepID=UPI001E5FC913|nr:hypothetical protein [Chryseobacterium gwangjuense]MCE3074321.1 hypothetical protein [Chryseobacterium gwangjuense]
MNEKDIWAIKLFHLYESKDIEKIKEKLFVFSDILIYLHEVLAEKKINLTEKDVYSEQLVIKIHLQNQSLLQISQGHSIISNFFKNKNSQIKFLDISSIITIVRSQYESLLMYQHLYINIESEEEKKLRFESWIMSSMMLRKKVFSNSKQKNNKALINEEKSIFELKDSIQNNPAFHLLSGKQQKSLLDNGSGKLFKNWDTIFDDSKFTKDGVFSKIYYIASVYAHSEGLLALQLKETKHLMENKNMKELHYIMLFYSYLMTNIMIKNIINKFPLVKERFETLEEKYKFEIDFNYQLSFK